LSAKCAIEDTNNKVNNGTFYRMSVSALDHAVENGKVAASEAAHRSMAEGEQARCDVAGDTMTPGEKLESVVNQVKHPVQTDVDPTKRDVRNKSKNDAFLGTIDWNSPRINIENTNGRGLRAPLIGAWKLVSYEERPVDGSPSRHPFGEQPTGIIMYTPDGYMSAQLSRPDRKPFVSGDWVKVTDEELKRQASTYIAYTGEFHVDEEASSLTHSVFVSLFPNWIGKAQPRVGPPH